MEILYYICAQGANSPAPEAYSSWKLGIRFTVFEALPRVEPSDAEHFSVNIVLDAIVTAVPARFTQEVPLPFHTGRPLIDGFEVIKHDIPALNPSTSQYNLVCVFLRTVEGSAVNEHPLADGSVLPEHAVIVTDTGAPGTHVNPFQT